MPGFITRSGFVLAALAVLGVLVFAKVSIDQTAVKRLSFVGQLDEPQLISLKNQLAELQATSSDTEVIRFRLVELAWVHHVNVRREWPAGLSVEVHPEVVMAYWNDDGFINNEGRVLVTDLLVGGDLPHLYGPPGTELEVMTRYQQLSGMLSHHGHEIRMLNRSERGAWTIETTDRVQVLLGKEDLKARMERFLEVSGELRNRGEDRRIDRMDARYINGVAVHFTDSSKLNLAHINKSVGERSL